jgi:LmbE family N-acetylglucosaminyl deacetylase
MKLTFSKDRILAVMAHPDDAELLCAGTLARGKADGAAIAICVMCRGDKGVSAGRNIAKLDQVRKREAQTAAKILGAELFWFGASDSELVDDLKSRQKLTEIYRRFRPTLIIAHSPNDYHVDHRAASNLAEAASWSCASAGCVTQSPATEIPPRLWWADNILAQGFEPGFYIDISEQLAIKQRMLDCHRSQLARGKDADFTPLMNLMIQQAKLRGAQSSCGAAEAFRWHDTFKRCGAF